ncbi:hypothetical protein [Streptomyces sp. NPDC001348]
MSVRGPAAPPRRPIPPNTSALSWTGPLSWVVSQDWIFLRIEAEVVTGREITGTPGTD